MVSTSDEPQTASADVQIQPVAEIKTISEEDFEKAQKTFQQGKKNLLLNKYAESVNNIEEACEVYSNKYGEFDPQCADVYFFFGKALLELARVENTVLGNALNGVPEDNEPIDDSRYGNPDEINAEEKDEISDKVIDALCNNNNTSQTEACGEKTSEEATKTKNGEETTPAATETTTTIVPATSSTEKPAAAEEPEKMEPKPESANPETTGDNKKEGDEEEGDEDEEEEDDEEDLAKTEEQKEEAATSAEAEEISNLQRSWEMFEMAKLVYSKNFNDDLVFKKKRIAECLLKLGEISIEQELYEQAITDIKESIRLQEEQNHEDRDERMLAESYYQQGISQQFKIQTEQETLSDAKESYQRSINILQLRTEKLRARLATLEGPDAESEKITINDEITEIESLIPELSGKLDEVNEQDQQSQAAIKEVKDMMTNVITTGLPGLTAAVANGGEVKDITSMMKSKRKISGGPDEFGGQKKTRLSANGAPSSSADENGVEMGVETTTTAAADTTPITETAPATTTMEIEKPATSAVVEEKPAETCALEPSA